MEDGTPIRDIWSGSATLAAEASLSPASTAAGYDDSPPSSIHLTILPNAGDDVMSNDFIDTANSPDTLKFTDERDSASPIFWISQRGRTVSNSSYRSIDQYRSAPISLEDHSEDTHELAQSCWAQSATVDEYFIISGPTGIGAYIVWHCTVRTLKGGDIGLRKRYSEFDQLHTDLLRAFPHAVAMIPDLPRKSVVSRFRPWFLEQRRVGLSHFLNCILLNPEFAASPILKDFIFS